MSSFKQGVLTYDFNHERYDIRFDLEDFYGGLHCGTGFEICINDKWIPTRIEMDKDWYLVGISKDISLIGLPVRMKSTW